MFEHPCAKLLLADAGDLLLWDARTVHGGLLGSGLDTKGLVRMAVTVAMVPRSWATEEVLKMRRLELVLEPGRCFQLLWPPKSAVEENLRTGRLSEGPCLQPFAPRGS